MRSSRDSPGALALQADDLLRGRGSFRLRTLASFVVAGGALYGAVMGSFGGPGLQTLFAALKLPLFIGTSTLVCLPSFYVLHLLLGVREDFRAALESVLAGQATLAICLASLAPVTAFVYLSMDSYRLAVLGQGVPFLLATIGAQVTMTRRYRPLVARNDRHRLTRNAWLFLYVFVAIQAAWVLRPFVGAPGLPASFFREEAWDNAYVRIARAIWEALHV